jgi:hypothetical protein
MFDGKLRATELRGLQKSHSSCAQGLKIAWDGSPVIANGRWAKYVKNGKPSISIRAIYTMAMLVITIAYPMLKPEFQAEFSENTRPSNGISWYFISYVSVLIAKQWLLLCS